MKNLFKPVVLLMTFAVLFSCDTDNEPDEDLRSEEANIISNNVEIKGASMLEGEPPTPNGGISLALVNASTAAYEDVGFTIPVSSDGDIVGAYLRFVSEDGKVADNILTQAVFYYLKSLYKKGRNNENI